MRERREVTWVEKEGVKGTREWESCPNIEKCGGTDSLIADKSTKYKGCK